MNGQEYNLKFLYNLIIKDETLVSQFPLQNNIFNYIENLLHRPTAKILLDLISEKNLYFKSLLIKYFGDKLKEILLTHNTSNPAIERIVQMLTFMWEEQ